MSSLVGERWTRWQFGIASIQAAWAGKETCRTPGWAGVSAKEASSRPGPPTSAPPAQPPPAASRSPSPSP